MSKRLRCSFTSGILCLVVPHFPPVAGLANECDTHGSDLVKVMVDLNPGIPGCQDFLLIEPGTTKVQDIAVYVFDPRQSRQLWDIGYIGGINRGIAFGHAPSSQPVGSVAAISGRPVRPVHPDNFGWVEPGYDPLFAGPEIQYVEGGFEAREPVTILADPPAPIFAAEVEFRDATQGDEFRFFVGDMVTIWFPEHGAFSAAGPRTLDTGGDTAPDGTETLYGMDADKPIPVPPAAYEVDYVDGEGGARIIVVVFGDTDFDGDIDLQDFAGLQNCYTGPNGGPVGRRCAVFDFNNDGRVDLQDYRDFAPRMTGP